VTEKVVLRREKRGRTRGLKHIHRARMIQTKKIEREGKEVLGQREKQREGPPPEQAKRGDRNINLAREGDGKVEKKSKRDR
jgi:hypothetical protein